MPRKRKRKSKMQTRKTKRPKKLANWTTVKGAKVSVKPKRKWGISPVTKLRQQRLRLYAKARARFLEANPICGVWLRRDACVIKHDGKMIGFAIGCIPQYSTEIHHKRGRNGELLLDERYWLAVSSENHTWIHNNIAEARKLGLIAQPGEWGKQE